MRSDLEPQNPQNPQGRCVFFFFWFRLKKNSFHPFFHLAKLQADFFLELALIYVYFEDDVNNSFGFLKDFLRNEAFFLGVLIQETDRKECMIRNWDPWDLGRSLRNQGFLKSSKLPPNTHGFIGYAFKQKRQLSIRKKAPKGCLGDLLGMKCYPAMWGS